MGWHPQLVEYSFVAMLSRGQCPNLDILLMPGASITDEGLASVASVSTLKELGLFFSLRITEVGIEHLASGQLSQLESLDLGCCFLLTDWITTGETHRLAR